MIVQRIARGKYSVLMWMVIALVVFGVSVGAGYWAATRQGGKYLEVDNKQALHSPDVSDKALVAYLNYAGISERVERVEVTYEPAKLAIPVAPHSLSRRQPRQNPP